MNILINTIKSHFVILILVVGFFITEVVFASQLFIWLDEAFTLNTTKDSLIDAVKRAVIFEGQPPFYFVLLNLWRHLDSSIFFARLFSILCISLAILLVYVVSLKCFHFQYPAIPAVLFAINPMVVWAGLEIRVYALVVLLSVLIVFAFYETYIKENNSKTGIKRLIFIFLALLAINTQYYLALLLISNFIFLLIRKDWKTAGHYLIDMIIPVAGIAFYYPYLASQIGGHVESNNDHYLFIDGLILMVTRVKDFIVPIPRLFDVNNLWIYMVLVVFILISIKGRIKSFLQDLINGENYFLTISFVLVGLFSIVYIVVGPYNIYPKHTILLIVPLVFSIVSVLKYVRQQTIKRLMFLGIIFLFVYNIPANIRDDKRRYELLDLKSYIHKSENHDIPLLFYRGETSITFKNIPGIKSEIYAVPGPISLDVPYNHCDWFIKNEKQLIDFFAQFQKLETFWLISNEPDGENLGLKKRLECKINFPVLNDFLDKYYRIEEEKNFDNRILLLRISKKNKD